MNIFKHIRSKYDRDPFANTFIRCNNCYVWVDSTYYPDYCPECGCDFNGTEDTKRGICPPGWEEDE